MSSKPTATTWLLRPTIRRAHTSGRRSSAVHAMYEGARRVHAHTQKRTKMRTRYQGMCISVCVHVKVCTSEGQGERTREHIDRQRAGTRDTDIGYSMHIVRAQIMVAGGDETGRTPVPPTNCIPRVLARVGCDTHVRALPPATCSSAARFRGRSGGYSFVYTRYGHINIHPSPLRRRTRSCRSISCGYTSIYLCILRVYIHISTSAWTCRNIPDICPSRRQKPLSS